MPADFLHTHLSPKKYHTPITPWQVDCSQKLERNMENITNIMKMDLDVLLLWYRWRNNCLQWEFIRLNINTVFYKIHIVFLYHELFEE